MAHHWQIRVLLFGKITVPKSVVTPGLDPDLVYDGPYLGFLLQKGNRSILVDTGISEKFIVDGKAWGGFPEGDFQKNQYRNRLHWKHLIQVLSYRDTWGTSYGPRSSLQREPSDSFAASFVKKH